jgi:hypothetical protein
MRLLLLLTVFTVYTLNGAGIFYVERGLFVENQSTWQYPPAMVGRDLTVNFREAAIYLFSPRDWPSLALLQVLVYRGHGRLSCQNNRRGWPPTAGHWTLYGGGLLKGAGDLIYPQRSIG